MGSLGTVTKVWKLPSVSKTFMSVAERLFRTYMTDALAFTNHCYIGKVLEDGQFGSIEYQQRDTKL